MAEFESDSPEDRLAAEAEELMRQKRFGDAASRYSDLRRYSPTDLWASLAHASALECAGKVDDAEQILEETAQRFRRSAALHRFRHLFFVRREDLARAHVSQAALESEVIEEGPEDQLADLYFNQGRYHEALAELERLRQHGVEDVELRAFVLARLGACLRQNGDHDRARERLLEALALDPDNHWTLSELAEVERALGNIDAARRRYEEALTANPEDHWCRGHLAQMEWEQGEADRAIELYDEILAAQPKAAWAKVELAQVMLDRDAARSEALCKAALDDDPAYPWAHAQLGNLARRAGDLEQARAHYLRALQAAPNSPMFLHELADICRNLGRAQEGYAHLEHAKGIDPYDATTYGYFADLLRHDGKNASALQYLEKAVELDDAYAWAWRELAELRGLAGERDDADRAYRKAVELEPGEAINDGLKAFLLRCAGRRDAAMPWLERAVERQPDYLWAWREQVELHLARGRAAEAEACARRALVHLPDSAPLGALLAEALRRQGKRAEARTRAEAALAHADASPQLWALLAELALEDDQPEQALAHAAKAAEIDAAPEWQALHAQVLVATGKLAEARPIVDRLLAQKQPLATAFELGAAIAERTGDIVAAQALLDRALAQFPVDARLITRRARIGLQLRESDATTRLVPLFDQEGVAPWREIAQAFASAGQAMSARRAAYLHLGAAAPHERGRAWLLLAELELALGNNAEAEQALAHALALDPDAVAGRILAAVVADQRGDLREAIRHLEHIDRKLHEPEPGEPPAGESTLLLRQLASLYERNRDADAAERCWLRIQRHQPDDPATTADHAGFLLRRGRVDEAAPLVEQALATAPAELPEAQRLLREIAVVTADRDGARAAVDAVLPHAARLSVANRLLVAQLALACGDAAQARAQVAAALAKEPEHRPALLLACRSAISSHDLADAERRARALADSAPADEEAASLLAEVLALNDRFAEALAALRRPALPERPSLERGLITAALALERDGEAHALAALGRIATADHQVPLVRLFAAAWPGAWTEPETSRPARPQDVLSVPPFPNLCRRLADALAGRARFDLAAALAVRAADALTASRPRESRRLRRQAVGWLVRLGQRRLALDQAWQARSPLALLRALRPW